MRESGRHILLLHHLGSSPPWPCFIYPPLSTILTWGYVHQRHCGVATDCRGNIISGGIPNLMFLKPFYSAVHHPSILLCIYILSILGASLVAQRLKRLPGIQEAQVRSLSWEDPLEKEMATHSSILAWRIPRREDHGRLQSMGSQRVRHDWATSLHFTLSKTKSQVL